VTLAEAPRIFQSQRFIFSTMPLPAGEAASGAATIGRLENAMARPKQIALRAPLTEEEALAACYVGSKEHKAARWWGGLPGARIGSGGVARRPKKQLTTICPLLTAADQARATGWVRKALKRKQCRFCDGDKTYPKHIWYMDEGGQFWFGSCMNGISGSYKGWPIDEAEKREAFN
jgi:hypothetical protein